MPDETRSKEDLLHEIAILRERVTGLEQTDKLRKSAIRMASFSIINPNPVIEIDTNGNITSFNNATHEVLKELGMGEDEMNVFVPERVIESFKKAEKVPAILTEEIVIKDRTFSETICFSLDHDAVCIYVYDITRYKRAEEKTKKLISVIRRDRDRLSILIDSIQDEVWFTNTRKRFTLANPVACREFGLDMDGPAHPYQRIFRFSGNI